MQETWVRSLGQEDPLKEGRKWQPLQYSCPENSLDRGYSPWGPKVSDTTKQLTRMHIHTYTYIHIHTHTYTYIYIAAVVQLPSHIQLFVTPWIAACQAASLKVFPSSCPLHQSCHPSCLWCPLLLLPSIFPSIRDFSNESDVCIRGPENWSFSFSISLSNEYSGLISLKIDWFDLAVQGILRCLLQHHSSKASILWCSAFFTVQLSQLYVTTGKTIVSTIWTFVSRVMSLLFNIQFTCIRPYTSGFPWWLSRKESASQCRRHGFDHWVRKSHGEGNGNPLQYSHLENLIDRGRWQVTIHGVTKESDMT